MSGTNSKKRDKEAEKYSILKYSMLKIFYIERFNVENIQHWNIQCLKYSTLKYSTLKYSMLKIFNIEILHIFQIIFFTEIFYICLKYFTLQYPFTSNWTITLISIVLHRVSQAHCGFPKSHPIVPKVLYIYPCPNIYPTQSHTLMAPRCIILSMTGYFSEDNKFLKHLYFWTDGIVVHTYTMVLWCKHI